MKLFKGPTRKGTRLVMQLTTLIGIVVIGQVVYNYNVEPVAAHLRTGRSLLEAEEEGSGSGGGDCYAEDTWSHGGRLSIDQVVARDTQKKCLAALRDKDNSTNVTVDPWADLSGSYPNSFAVFTKEQMKSYGWVPHVFGVIYTFWALAIICDDFFVPSLDVIEERFDVKPDIAGATLMAAGGSAPELAMSFIGTFLTRSNVGFAAIVGSAVFNVLFVIGCCAMFSSGELKLTAWPLFRDSMWYMVCLAALVIAFGVTTPDYITLGEAIIMFSLYILYVILCKYSEKLRKTFAKCFAVFKTDGDDDDEETMEMKDMSPEAKAAAKKSRKFKKNLHRMGSIFGPATKEKLQVYRRKSATHLFVDIAAAHAAEGGVSALIQEISDTDHVTRKEFTAFLHEHKMTDEMDDEEIKTLFDSMDTNSNNTITKKEFALWFSENDEVAERLHLQAKAEMAEFMGVDEATIGNIKKAAVEKFLDHTNRAYLRIKIPDLEMNGAGECTLADFSAWFGEEMRAAWKADMTQKPAKQPTITAEDGDDGEDGHIEWPNTEHATGIFASIVAAPMMLLFLLTIPDVRNNEEKDRHWFLGGYFKKEENLWMVAFFMSIVWIIVYSYLMVWWTTLVGIAWGIPNEVMGLTFLAAGTSIPDLLTSVAVARKGHGDMAVSSSIGSNIFDVAFGLPVPWLIFAAVYEPVGVGSESLFLSVGLLLAMLFLVVLLIIAFKWTMTKGLGAFMFLLYIVFVAQDLGRRDL